MRRVAVPIWTAIVITLAGLWTAVVPFVWPTITGLFTASSGGMMMHAASSTSMSMGLSPSIFIYHIVPGGLAALLGAYQLAAAYVRAARPAPAEASRTLHEAGATT